MTKKQVKKTIIEVRPPGFTESLNEIFSITGKNVDFSMFSKPFGKRRLFKDEKGIFKEMDKGKKKGKVTIAE